MARIVFFSHAKREHLDEFEYYRQDIDALRALGHELVLCTRYIEIPRRFDAMFIWWWTRALAPVLLCRAMRKPSIVTGTFNFKFPNDFEGTDYFRRPYWQRAVISGAATRASLNLFVSQLEFEACARHFELRTARYYPHCVDADYLQGPSAERTATLLNIAWSGKQNLVRKGIPELLDAIRLLKERGERVRLSLAGLDGDGAGWLQDRIARLGLSDVVEHLGPVSREEKIRILRRNEVYVQPSHFEGFGLAILEAMGSGGCVVVCDVGAVREVVGDCGVYVRRSSPEEIAESIAAILGDTMHRRRLQMAAATRAREHFTFDRKVERLRGYLAEIGIASPPSEQLTSPLRRKASSAR
jgi:glycosyltransferase involved in cell wall biosynthesis